MKTSEQIKEAKEMIKELQDYVELARVEKKLKDEFNAGQVSEIIEAIKNSVEIRIKNI